MIFNQHSKYDIRGDFVMNMITRKIIGQTINTLLAEQNKRQKDLAKELGVTDNTISYFVSGSRTPNLEQITTIADFFMCQPIICSAVLMLKRKTQTSAPYATIPD